MECNDKCMQVTWGLLPVKYMLQKHSWMLDNVSKIMLSALLLGGGKHFPSAVCVLRQIMRK